MISMKNLIRVIGLIIAIGVVYMIAKSIGLLWIGVIAGLTVVASIIYRNKKLQTVKVKENNLVDTKR